MMICPNCKTGFNVVQPQIIRDIKETIESEQVYCPVCFLVISNKPMIVGGIVS